jgi:hypothetical protein
MGRGVCVRHTRVTDSISPARLVAACPRLQGKVGEMDTEDHARTPGASLFNRSAPPQR